MEPVALTTDRLELSAPTAADTDAIFRACQDADIQRYTTVPSPYERRHAEEFVAKVAGWWADGSETTWALRRDGALVGMIGLHRIGHGAAEIGFWVASSARGHKLVGEAALAVIDWGFASDELELVRIEWRAVVGNVGSARVARALGFRYEGMLRLGVGGSRGRRDAWVAGLLRHDDRAPQEWPVPGA